MIKFTQRLSVLTLAFGLYTPLVNADQVVLDDHIVVGSICVGLDCVNGENFNFDTIRLKENNLRIKFIDSSSSSSFPTVDWEIVVNDSVNGGINRFSIAEGDSGNTPFTIISGADNHSFYMASSGNIGFGTSTPLVELHVQDGNSPALRLHQDGTSGFAEQIWDVGGNETNFFIRDVSNGSALPLRISSSAPNASLHIANDGDVGFGTTTPDGQFDVAHVNDDNNHAFLIGTNSAVGVNIDNGFEPNGLFEVQTTGGISRFIVQADGDVGIGSKVPNGRFDVLGTDGTTPYFNVDASGDVGIGTSAPTGRFEVTSLGGASSYLAVDAAGNVGIGTNIPNTTTPIMALSVTKADAKVLINDTTVPAAKELRTLLKLQSHYGNQIQFAVDDKAGQEWSIGTSKSGSTFQISQATSNNLTVGNGILNLTNSTGDLVLAVKQATVTALGTFISGSSRTIKNNIVGVDSNDILDTLSNLEIKKWNYIA
ncbi:MAG: hypothetical protein RPS47_14065, partial [Colwellia sp.]